MTKINSSEIYNKITTIAKEKSIAGAMPIFNEIKGLSTIIELSKTKDGLYRFGQKHNQDIIEAFEKFKTKLDKRDVLNSLLSIGNTNSQQLTAEEIVKILTAITNCKPKEQKNLLQFLKYTIENDFDKPTEKTKQRFTLERFEKIINNNNEEAEKSAEKELETLYNEVIQRRVVLKNSSQIPKPKNYIIDNNREIIYAIARAKDVEIFAELLDEIGPIQTLKKIPNELIKLYRYSIGNCNFAYDLAKYFEPEEVKLIAECVERYPEIKEYLPRYSRCFAHCFKTQNERKAYIIRKIGLQDIISIKIEPVGSYSDAMHHCYPGNYGTKR